VYGNWCFPNLIWVRNDTIPTNGVFKWEWNFSSNPSPLNKVSIFQITVFSNDDNLKVYINNTTTPTLTLSYNVSRSTPYVYTWSNVSYARIELDNAGGSWCSLDLGVYFQY